MNERFKFRVWYYQQEKFDYNVGLQDFSKYSFPLYWACVQQYTGIKDKNGKDIYEGDLIQYNQNSSYDGMSFEVKWSEDSLGWIFQSKTGEELTNEWTPNGNRFKLIEVVGNVYES